MSRTRNLDQPRARDRTDDSLSLRKRRSDVLVSDDHDGRGANPTELFEDSRTVNHPVDRAPDVSASRQQTGVALDLILAGGIVKDRSPEHDGSDPSCDDASPEHSRDCGEKAITA